jgi:glycosyltransferase involved in cell wall biosynthesis
VVQAASAPEPFGRVLLEAMACGRAAVARSDGGAAEILDDGSAAMGIRPDDDAALADAVERLVGDRERRGELGRRARQRVVACFSHRDLAPRIADLYGVRVPVHRSL